MNAIILLIQTKWLYRTFLVHLLRHSTLLPSLPKPLLPPTIYLWTSNRMHVPRGTIIRLLTAPLATRLHIPTTRTAAQQPHLYQPREDSKRRGDPHEDEQRDANLRTNVQLRHPSNSVAEDDEHDGRDDGAAGCEERGDEDEDRYREIAPAGVDGEGYEGDQDGVEAGGGEEEAEHYVGDDADEVEDGVDLVWEGDWRGNEVSWAWYSSLLKG